MISEVEGAGRVQPADRLLAALYRIGYRGSLIKQGHVETSLSGSGPAGLLRTRSADRTLHLQFDQPIELQRVFHRKLPSNRLYESADDHRHCLVLTESSAPEVE
jgi:hypothetical protein